MPRARGSFRTQFEFQGVTQLQRLMEGMDLRDQTKVLEGALDAAAKPIVEASRREIDGDDIIRTGALRKAMGYIVRSYPRTGKLVAYIGARHIAYAGNVSKQSASTIRDTRPLAEGEIRVVPSKYIHLVHEGFFNKLVGRFIPGRPFLKRAFEANIAQAEWTLLSGAADALEKVWKRNVARFTRSTFKKAA